MILTVFSFSGIFDNLIGSIKASQCKGKVDKALRAIREQLENDSNCCNHLLEKWEGGVGYEDWLMTAIRKCLGSDACGHPYVYCTGIDAFDDPNCSRCKIVGTCGSTLSSKTLICCNNTDKGLRKSEHCNLVHTILHECLHACKRADLDPEDKQIDDYEYINPDGIDAQLGKWVDCWCKE